MDLSPMTRYSDTTLLIHDEWIRGHEKVAFPTVYAFLYRHETTDEGDTGDQRPNGMLQQQEEKFMRIRGQKVGYKYNNRDIRRPNGMSRKRRSREIAEKRSSRKSVELRIVENETQETPLVIEEPPQEPPRDTPQETVEVVQEIPSKTTEDQTDSGEKVQVQISADVHSVPATDINENTVLEDAKKEIVLDVATSEPEITVPEPEHEISTEAKSSPKSPVPEPPSEPDEILAIVEPLDEVCEIRVKAKDADGGSPQSLRHISRTSSMSSRSGARSPIPGTVIGVPIRRKQYASISETSFDDPTSSSYDESDEPDYAKVEHTGKNHENQPIIPKSQSFPATLQPKKSSASQATETLRLHYVTERILASVLPPRTSSVDHLARPHSENSVAVFEEDEYERELITMLEQKHNKNYQMFDLESCIATISLEKLCELCKHIDAWLGGGREKVVVLQDRGDRQRLGAAIAAYLEYQKICGSNFPSRSLSEDQRIARKWLDLDIYSMQKFLEDVVGPLRVPSHRRYLQYFSGLLSGGIRMNSSPQYLKYVSLESPPSWLHYSSFASQNAEWRCFLKVYEGLKCVFTSDIHVIPFATRQFIFQVGHLRLRGDIILRCYQIVPQEHQPSVRELMFSTQFHTCAIGNRELTFLRHDLDFACDDPRFPADHKVILHFNSGSPAENRGFVFQSPLVRIEPANTLANSDSLENINEAASKHLQGPLDGSLYATILKSPKSPQHSPQLSLPSTPVKPVRASSQQNLISPPPEFSSPKIIVSAHNSQSVRNSTPVPRKDPIQTIPRAYSQPPVRKPGTPQPPERHSSTHVVHNYPPNQTQIRVIEEYRYKTQDNTTNGNPGHSRTHANEHDGRESVRSPLTLSMDSGISSSGIVNRRLQGSSVSPSSFPSQASPQDRHRELDDILSDMLMTVQDIPDISANSVSQQRVKRSVQVPYNTSTVKRSPSANRPSDIHDSVTKTPSGGDPYDTASTATTLTPPPSESGRDTPIVSDKRSVDLETRSDSALVMNLHTQSFAYPQPQHTVELISVTSDEDSENIPYHAREDSRPFTYGNVSQGPQSPPASVMLKMQSGLSSPSLVRKQLNQQGGGHRKTPIRNDFEEMLRERREKVSGEKYSISDRTPNGSNTLRSYTTTPGGYTTTETRWYSNGYHEPLKRSNTMDGGFGRSTSTEGLTGQSWLQLQQQKLRARNQQKLRDERDVFESRIHTEITGRPFRSRSSASKRYDGYTSDTTFADEVDYRRPLHVQTPTRNDRNYHTLTTTTTSVKERPFVAVRRAHDQAKQQTIVREESISSYNDDFSPIGGSPRPETPAFPVTPRTPYSFGVNGNTSPALPPKSPTSQRRFGNPAWSLRSQKTSVSTHDWSKDLYSGHQVHHLVNQNDSVSCYTSRRNSTTSNANSEPQEVAPHHVKFVRDSSKYWYKPNITREQAANLLRDAQPGTFIVRDSKSFANAFGLVLKVAYPPPHAAKGGSGDELVRHFLVEPTTRGVRLKGCANEPVFTSLSALVYQHSITPLALPCRLLIPERDIQHSEYPSPAQQQLLLHGAACNVMFLCSVETESLTGPEAVRKAVTLLFSRRPLPTPTRVHFKVTNQGITLTDNTRQLFFRKHYPSTSMSHCSLDPDERRWSVPASGDIPVVNNRIFAFVARRSSSSMDNVCHIFCELEPTQPATAITSFANQAIFGGVSSQPAISRAI